jgi:hypothetical protein
VCFVCLNSLNLVKPFVFFPLSLRIVFKGIEILLLVSRLNAH